jgi:hypothetical protein
MSFINNKWHERRNIKPATTLKRAGKAKIRPEFSHECIPSGPNSSAPKERPPAWDEPLRQVKGSNLKGMNPQNGTNSSRIFTSNPVGPAKKIASSELILSE